MITSPLKSNPATRDIIVLALTAYAMAGDEETAHRAGCSGYVTKPVDTRTLPATVKLHLEPRQAARPAFEAGDYHDMLAELRNDNSELTRFLRATHEVCEKHNDVATASLIENWIDETERRTWFLSETIAGR